MVWKIDRLARRVMDFLRADEALWASGQSVTVRLQWPPERGERGVLTPPHRNHATIAEQGHHLVAPPLSSSVS